MARIELFRVQKFQEFGSDPDFPLMKITTGKEVKVNINKISQLDETIPFRIRYSKPTPGRNFVSGLWNLRRCSATAKGTRLVPFSGWVRKLERWWRVQGGGACLLQRWQPSSLSRFPRSQPSQEEGLLPWRSIAPRQVGRQGDAPPCLCADMRGWL